MRTKKLIACLVSCSMFAASTAAFAAAPSAYDGQAYSSLGYESDDSDGVFNLAVIANGDVKIYGDTMYIEGSVYSNGTIYGGNGSGNVIKGVFISGTENQSETGYGDLSVTRYGYVHVDDDGNTDVTNAYSVGLENEGAVLDKNTSFDYSYEEYTYPEISNYVSGETVANQYYPGVITVSEDTHYETVRANGAGLVIDASNGDVTVVIDKMIVDSNPYIKTIGDGHVNLYVKDWESNNNVNLELMHVSDATAWDVPDQWAYIQNSIYTADSNNIPRPNETVLNELDPSKIDFYIDTESGTVALNGARIAANIHSNADTLTIGNNLEIYGNIESGATTFETVSSGYINGVVSVPNAASTVHNSSCIQGQLITDTLLINGAGAILNQTDSLVVDDSTTTPEPDSDSQYKLDIIEDVVYVVIGDDYPVFTLDKNTNYTWSTSSTYVYFSSNSLGENQYYPGYFTADDVTMAYSGDGKYWGVMPGDEVTITATSVDDATVTDSAKIIFVASKDDIPNTEATPEPTVEPTAEPTLAPIPQGDEIDLNGVGYAYIFGYEPKIEYVWNEETESGSIVAEVQMAPNDGVTREQVSAMIMRLIDQKYDTKDASYDLTDNMTQHEGTWYARGLGYLASTGAFDGIDSVDCGAVTRGEVAKLVTFGLNLSDTEDVDYTDVAGNQYEEYIKIMSAYGYMNGMDDGTFQPDKVMTRAEFCAMFNNIIGRTNAGLTAEDGTEVTPELYSIVDLDADAWYTDVMLKATSAYDDNGYVDIETRLSNIRNILDNYESQILY